MTKLLDEIHPGEILFEDFMKPMGVTVRALALALHIPYSRLCKVVRGKRGVSADTALRLERYFGSDARDWLNLQAEYELRLAKIKAGEIIAAEVQPFERAPVDAVRGSRSRPR